MNPVLPIYFFQSCHDHWLVVHILILFLKTARDISSLREIGMRFQIFGANEGRAFWHFTIYLFLLNYMVF